MDTMLHHVVSNQEKKHNQPCLGFTSHLLEEELMRQIEEVGL